MLPAFFLLASAEALLPVTLARPASAAPRPRIASPPRLMETTEDRIKAMVEGNKIFLFMKGSKLFPQCGFSNTAVQILNSYNVEYETFDVLADNAVRDGVKTCGAALGLCASSHPAPTCRRVVPGTRTGPPSHSATSRASLWAGATCSSRCTSRGSCPRWSRRLPRRSERACARRVASTLLAR